MTPEQTKELIDCVTSHLTAEQFEVMATAMENVFLIQYAMIGLMIVSALFLLLYAVARACES